MLKVPSKTEQKILNLAKFFEDLPPERYNQSTYLDHKGARCICGWVNWHSCRISSEWKLAAEELGLTEYQARKLFDAHPVMGCLTPDPKMAAKVLRNLASTGEVSWYADR